jgi:exodeoxyribonuclease VII small subunit
VAKSKTKADAPADGTETTPLSFEASIAALGQVVEQLEGGDLPLEQSLELFEQGIRLSREAQALLDSAEKRIETLLGFDDDGAPVTREPEPKSPR